MPHEDITHMLARWTAGEREQLSELFPLVYDELRRTAAGQVARNNDPTLQPTALLHEAYLRLNQGKNLSFPSRQHFFAFASTVMRQVIVERARSRSRQKHGGGASRLALDECPDLAEVDRHPEIILAIDRELDQLKQVDPRKSAVMVMSYFAGMTAQEISVQLDLGIATVKRDLKAARLWLTQRIAHSAL